ncbi:hypothetical protein [Campylobacter jejuni]|uniref:hypothetical protein n=1 Tax=Campylobacter jejuni TaxID=197 RepID=UPI002043B43D|nr:hypothetical protein [Campylobacter jejuni]
MEYIDAQVQHIKPQRMNILEYLRKNNDFILFLNSLVYLNIIFLIIMSFYKNNSNILVFVIIVSILTAFIAVNLSMCEEEKDEKEAIIPNEKNKDYLISLGIEVKNFMAMLLKVEKRKIIKFALY